jgi:hypothetical protein
MIFTVFTAGCEPAGDWRAQLLEYSWRRLRQPGELIRLTPTRAGQEQPRHRAARVVATSSWNPHPYTNDFYAGYETAAAALEWLFRERIDGTILLLGPRQVLQHSVVEEVRPGQARANPWPDLPRGDGPFGLSADLRFLECYCVNRELPLAPVRLPLVIHSTDLRKIAARWSELTAIMRAEHQGVHGKLADADRIAYAIAAAEYRLQHQVAELATDTDGPSGDVPVIDYVRPIESPRGEIIWDEQVYQPWADVFPERARPGAGRDFLALLNEMVTRLQSRADLGLTRPLRRPGVREARIVDDLHLEVPGAADPILLNHSAAAIWELCDGTRTLAQIAGELAQRFEAPHEALNAAVESTTRELENAGALELEDLIS